MRERQRLHRVLDEEDKIRKSLKAVLERRDAMLREMRWGRTGPSAVRPVRPESLRAATKCARYPRGLSRTTFYRAVGRTEDAPTEQGSAQDDPT